MEHTSLFLKIKKGDNAAVKIHRIHSPKERHPNGKRMNLLTDISIKVTPQEVLQPLCRGRRDPSWMLDEAKVAIETALDLWLPVIVFDWVRVLGRNGETITVLTERTGQKTNLQIGPHAHLLSNAEMALVSTNSIGAKLDKKVNELNQKGENLAAYILDSVGVVGLSKVGSAASALAEQEAARRYWGVGPRLSPGSLKGWSMEGQHDLCSMLPLEQGGLKLNQNGLIIPFKSASGLIGLGPEYQSSRVGSVCNLCEHKDSCWRRQPDTDENRG